MDSNNLVGSFLNNDTFIINMKPYTMTYGGWRKSTLLGEIKELQNNSTQVILKAKPSLGYYLSFFVGIIAGFAYLLNFLKTGTPESLLWSCLAFFGGIVLCIGISNLVISVIHREYVMYIHKEIVNG